MYLGLPLLLFCILGFDSYGALHVIKFEFRLWGIHVNKMHEMRKHVFSEDLAVLGQGCSVTCGECDPVECLLFHVYT